MRKVSHIVWNRLYFFLLIFFSIYIVYYVSDLAIYLTIDELDLNNYKLIHNLFKLKDFSLSFSLSLSN